MASQAEIDLIVNASRTLPNLERDLDRVLTAAQGDMQDLDVNAVLRTSQSLNNIERDLNRIIRQATDDADPLAIQAAIDQRNSLRDIQGDLDDLVTAINAGDDVDEATIRAALDIPNSITRLDDDLRTVVRAVQATDPEIEVDVEIDRDRSLARILSTLTPLISGLGRAGGLAGSLGAVGAAAGTAAPLLAGVAGAVQNIVPAAAVATTGIIAMQLASNALKLGMMGVEEAISEAFTPDADMEAVNKALARLSPSARATATEIIGLKDAFRDLQLDVQETLFKGFAGEVRGLADGVLPDLKRGLVDAAGALNQMGKGVSQAGQALSDSGVLGQALKSATNGLEDLVDLPGQATIAFGQLAAAAGPSFERITTAIAKVADGVSASLSGAFKSGALEDAIGEAVDAISQLGRVAGNIFGGIGNIIDAVSLDGQGLFGTLEQLSQGFEDLTGTQQFQDGLRALAETMALLYKTAGPLLAEAFKIVGSVLVELSGPAQELIALLGEELGEIFKELSPVMVELAGTVGKLVGALSPLLVLAADLITALLPSLTPLLETLGTVFEEMTPFIAEVANILGSLLLPVLEKLPGFLEVILTPFNQFIKEIFPVLVEQLERMAPDFEELGKTMADLLEDLAPLIAQFLTFVLLIDEKLIPIIGGALIGTLALLAKALNALFKVFDEFVIPIVQTWIDLLQGDFRDGNDAARQNVIDLSVKVRTAFDGMVNGVITALNRYVTEIRGKINMASLDFVTGIREMINDGVNYIGELPGRIQAALGNLGNLLYQQGQQILVGLISGIQSKIGEVQSTLGGITDLIPDWKGPMDVDKKLLTPSGVAIMDSLVAGFQKAAPRVRAELQGLTLALPGMAAPSAISAPAAGTMAVPNVSVYVGGERFDQYVTVRAEQVYNQQTRTAAQGVRN